MGTQPISLNSKPQFNTDNSNKQHETYTSDYHVPGTNQVVIASHHPLGTPLDYNTPTGTGYGYQVHTHTGTVPKPSKAFQPSKLPTIHQKFTYLAPNHKAEKPQYSITDILRNQMKTPISLISGFMSRMKEAGATLKVRKAVPPKPALPTPIPVQVVPTAQPEDYLTNFEEINSIKDDLFDLADISEKELLAYSRVQAMLAELEEEQKKQEDATKKSPPMAAIPPPLENPFDSIVRRSDGIDVGERRSNDDDDEDDTKAYLVARLEDSDLTDDELIGYLRVQTILHRIGSKV
jgi:hypothetical protein